MGTLLADLRFALRVFRRNPGFTAAVVITIALGVGANTLVFGVADAVLFKPLPYPHAERLVHVWQTRLPEVPTFPVAPANFADIRNRTAVFEDIGWSRDAMYNLTGGSSPEMLLAYRFSANFLDVMGVRPALGRFFRKDEMRPGQDRVALLSDRLWRRRFAADAAILGRSITLNGEPYTVIGVMGPEFRHPQDVEIWTPLALPPDAFDTRDRSFLRLVARLAAGVTVEDARRELNALAAKLQRDHPATNASVGFRVVSLRDSQVGDIRPALLVLLGVVAFVLVAACANVASLLLARAADRRHEIGVRVALGASRGRLLRQLMTESLLLAAAGGTLGLLLALWGVDWLVALFPRTISNLDIPRVESIPIDLRVLGFTAGVTLLTGVLFGLAPVRQLAVARTATSLQTSGKGTSDGAGGVLRTALVVAQVALAMVLLVGAALLAKSFARLNTRNLGFDAENVLTLRLLLPQQKYATPESWRAYADRILPEVQRVPGVQRVGMTNFLPLSGWNGNVSYTVAGRPAPAPGRAPLADYHVADAGYFGAMSIRLVGGRVFSPMDREHSERVAIVNETLARAEWPGRAAVGEYLEIGASEGKTDRWRVVGVVGDVRHDGPGTEVRRQVYLPLAQAPSPFLGVAVRASGEPAVLADAIQRAIWRIDRDQPVTYVMTTGELAREALAPTRVSALLVGLFAFVALALAAVGTHGLLASLVARRTHEIGVRVALGADRREVVSLVLTQTMRLVVAGVVLGVLAAVALGRAIASVLYQVSPTDPIVYASVTTAILATAVVASVVPAWRAASIDAAVALRAE